MWPKPMREMPRLKQRSGAVKKKKIKPINLLFSSAWKLGFWNETPEKLLKCLEMRAQVHAPTPEPDDSAAPKA